MGDALQSTKKPPPQEIASLCCPDPRGTNIAKLDAHRVGEHHYAFKITCSCCGGLGGGYKDAYKAWAAYKKRAREVRSRT